MEEVSSAEKGTGAAETQRVHEAIRGVVPRHRVARRARAPKLGHECVKAHGARGRRHAEEAPRKAVVDVAVLGGEGNEVARCEGAAGPKGRKRKSGDNIAVGADGLPHAALVRRRFAEGAAQPEDSAVTARNKAIQADVDFGKSPTS